MYNAYWNGLFDTRWEDAPLGREVIRLVLWLRERAYAEYTRRLYGHARTLGVNRNHPSTGAGARAPSGDPSDQ